MFTSERLKGIDVFVAVSQTGSFTSAADKLSVSNSAISKSISRLERRLSVKLFHRTTRRLSLTEAGKVFYKTCSRVLDKLEQAEHTLRNEQGEVAGRVRIDLPASYGRRHALPAILNLVDIYPDLQPHISFTDQFVDLLVQDIDVVVRIGWPDPWLEGVRHHQFGSERLVYCAAPSYLNDHPAPSSFDELEAHHLVLYGRTDGVLSPWYLGDGSTGERQRRSMPARLAAGDGEGVMISVLAGFGIAQLPTWLIQEYLDRGALIQVLPELASKGRPMHLAWLKRSESLPRVEAVVGWLKQKLTDPCPSNPDYS
ncbi:LysR family transcriptional regulator [Pseudomonas pudica]|uniref:LysR family transcriptional regulator n=1 Tax=Pseudomonas pudica TaxID=272772 RepID=A0ABS0FUK7_9PSED|nr:LysR family transcriptional regulator [Pseudomonas pudica]MBF8644017.1 LysR family transcriptional regulator [Pseudomonas pudica]MBF8758616.1 LysR family transcriptional regulator [Pseudomonas pudica]